MSKIQTGESITQYVIRQAFETGQFWNPSNPGGHNIRQRDLKKLVPSDPVVVQALISYAKMDAPNYTKHVLNKHGRLPYFDGVIGPAMQAMALENARCPVPDFAPPPDVDFAFEDPALQQVCKRMQLSATLPALGVGNWKSCHGIGDFHCVIVSVDQSGLPPFLKSLFKTVLTKVQKAYADIGLLFKFVGSSGIDLITGVSVTGNIGINMSFVSNSSGWIGLAIVGQGETCTSQPIWCQFLSTYKGGSTDADIVTQWVTLIKHELGHNCGRSHTTGGVMNPSIVNGLPNEWAKNDPSYSWLVSQFGGQPVIIGGGDPPSPPPPDLTLQQQIDSINVYNAVQDGAIQWCISRLTK